MTKKKKFQLVTAIVAVLMFAIALPFTDGNLTGTSKDLIVLLYPGSLIWIYLRAGGKLKFPFEK